MDMNVPLWNVRTRTDPMPASSRYWDQGQIGHFHLVATRKRGEVWESLVWGAEWRLEELRARPEVIDVARAKDSPFSDKTFGTIVIADGGTRWYHEARKTKPWKKWPKGILPRDAGTWPRWRQRMNKTYPPAGDDQ
jgi:hypothetical protein